MSSLSHVALIHLVSGILTQQPYNMDVLSLLLFCTHRWTQMTSLEWEGSAAIKAMLCVSDVLSKATSRVAV